MTREEVMAKIAGVSMMDHERLASIEQSIEQTRHLDGDMAELGVFRGGTTYFMHWCNPSKIFHLFDTFTGCPEDDVYETGHRKGDFAASIESVQSFLGIGNYRYHIGRFPDIASGERFSFVHVDCDLRVGVETAIAYFWPRMVVGGIIAFDDYGWGGCPGVKEVLDASGLRIDRLTGNADQVQATVIKEHP